MRNGRCYRNRQRKRLKERVTFCQSHKYEYVLLRKWIHSCDKACNIKLDPCIFPETGRGLQTKDVINKGEIILSIPACCLITPEKVLQSEIGKIIKKFNPKLSPQRILSVFLVFEAEKGDNSKWHPYLQSLPDSYTTPLYFTNQELQRLPANIYKRAYREHERLQTIFKDIYDHLFYHFKRLDFFTYKKFRWAWSVVNTRSVYVKTKDSPYIQLLDGEKDVALAPYLDLLNHSSSARTQARLNPDTERFEITTLDNYEKYSQVFICYNPYSNENLFMEYGFTLPNNPFNIYEFGIDEIRWLVQELNIPHWDKKRTILEENELSKGVTCSSDGLSWKLQTVLRILCMSWDELSTWKVVYKGEFAQEKELEAVHISTLLINAAMAKNQKYLRDSDEMPDHDHLALTLAQDYATILKTCLHQLKMQHL